MFKSATICVYLCLMLFNQSPEFDLLIRGGRIVDGSGRPAYTADVAIKNDRIVKIGNLSQATATRTIDARNLVVPDLSKRRDHLLQRQDPETGQ